MKVKNIKIFSAILLVFIFNLIAPNMKVNASKNDDKYDLTISYGIEGSLRKSWRKCKCNNPSEIFRWK